MLVYSKCIDQRDFSDPELAPYLTEVAELHSGHLCPPKNAPRLDTRNWQMAMTLRASRTLFAGAGRRSVAAIGDGDGPLQFGLARDGHVVFTVDTFLDRTLRSDETPAGMLVRPRAFAPFPTDRGDVIAIDGDPRALPLPSCFVDFAYSHNLLNTLQSSEAITAAVQEMARILCPGGVACIALDMMLDSPAGLEWAHPEWLLPTATAVDDLVISQSGLTLVGDGRHVPMSPQTFAGRSIIDTLAWPGESYRHFRARRDTPPNLVMFHDGALFCSLHLTLRKEQAAGVMRIMPSPFDAEIDERSRTIERKLIQLSHAEPLPRPMSFPFDAEEELEGIRQSVSWRLTAPLRLLEAALRRLPLALRIAMALRRALRRR